MCKEKQEKTTDPIINRDRENTSPQCGRTECGQALGGLSGRADVQATIKGYEVIGGK